MKDLKMNTKNLIAALTLLVGSQSSFATDAYQFANLGFSADAKYYAFASHVQLDGSGFPAAVAYVIDVATNTIVRTERVVLEDDKATEAQALKQVEAKLDPAKYGIDGKQPGRSLWVQLDTDYGPAQQTALFATAFLVNEGASAITPLYRLDLTETEAPTPADKCFSDNGNKMMALALTKMSGHTVVEQKDLQKDTHAPKSRACSWNYQIRRVVTFKGAIAVQLRYSTFGFEGPDYNNMVVTTARGL